MDSCFRRNDKEKMEIKYTFQGLLIYIAMGAYLLAFVTTLLRRRKTGRVLYLFGFIVAVLSFGYRWYDVRHVPLQNLFEVFLCLGMIYPVTLFCYRFLRVGGLCGDMLIGAIVLFPAGFVFNAEPQRLPPAFSAGFLFRMLPSICFHIYLWPKRLSRPFANWPGKTQAPMSRCWGQKRQRTG